jgi:hypothetical protein
VKKAVENVYNHRTSQIPNTEENSLVLKDTKAAKKSKIKSERTKHNFDVNYVPTLKIPYVY